MFRQWLAAIKEHRVYDQFQNASQTVGTGTPTVRLSSGGSNISTDNGPASSSSSSIRVEEAPPVSVPKKASR